MENTVMERIFNVLGQANAESTLNTYSDLGLKYNPFPRSGATDINGNDRQYSQFAPLDPNVLDTILSYISSSLQDNVVNKEDKFISATVTGNYGSGKTQLLMYVRYLLGEIADQKQYGKIPYIVYLDNPGVNLLEFIGSILSKIGEENFKKYLWKKIIDNIKSNEEYKLRLNKFQNHGIQLLANVDPDPYSSDNSQSYKKFLNSFIKYINNIKVRKDFEENLKDVLLNILIKDTNNNSLAYFFYQLLSEDFGVNKIWEALSTGNIKQLDRKESLIIKYIVKLIKEQGYTDFFILVDEFEDITEGRLSKSQADNYVHNLRTLLDEHREWCLMFAMTGEALKKLRAISPPLADRITVKLINLQDFNRDQSSVVVKNYLKSAKIDNDDLSIYPFTESGIEVLNDKTDGNARLFLRSCFYLIEKAVSLRKTTIDSEFVKNNLD